MVNLLGIFGTQFVTNLYEKNVSRVVTTIKLWNSLPLNLRRHLNVRIFKNKYVETLHAHQQSLSHF